MDDIRVRSAAARAAPTPKLTFSCGSGASRESICVPPPGTALRLLRMPVFERVR